MFDLGNHQIPGAAATAAPGPLDASEVTAWTGVLARADGPASDADRVDMLRSLEELKCVAEAMQAVLAADLDACQRRAQAAAGVPPAPTAKDCANSATTPSKHPAGAPNPPTAHPPADTIELTTPTGHRHRSTAPDLPRPSPDIRTISPAEISFSRFALAG